MNQRNVDIVRELDVKIMILEQEVKRAREHIREVNKTHAYLSNLLGAYRIVRKEYVRKEHE